MDESAEMTMLLARALAGGPGGVPLAESLCRACLEMLGATGAAITLATTRTERLTVWATDATSEGLENLQDVIGEGPGQDAFDSGESVVVTLDRSSPGRYAVFGDMADDLAGEVTVWALPMRPTGTTIGVLTLYSDRGRLRRTLGDAQRIADAVGMALLEDALTEVPTSLAAWSDRAVVHQAIGMLVARLGVPPADALALLRAHAYTVATSLSDVASAVVSRRLDLVGPSDDDGAEGPAGGGA